MAGMDVGINADYNTLNNCAAPCNEKNPWGVALYVTPKSGKMSYPIRLEYIKDGGGVYLPRSGIDVNNAYTFTVTPTYHLNDNAFVRAELSYVGADKQASSKMTARPKTANYPQHSRRASPCNGKAV